MCAEERVSSCTGEAQAVKLGSRPLAALAGKDHIYRARNKKDDPLTQLVLNNLQEFEQWLKDPPDNRPRPSNWPP